MIYNAEQLRELIKNDDVQAFYNSRAWRKLSRKVIRENHGECYLCRLKGRYSRAVLVHHVRELKQFPELAYSRTYTDTDGVHVQLMPLCHECHERQHDRGFRPNGKQQDRFTNEERW